jgi:hypothetical protein
MVPFPRLPGCSAVISESSLELLPVIAELLDEGEGNCPLRASHGAIRMLDMIREAAPRACHYEQKVDGHRRCGSERTRQRFAERLFSLPLPLMEGAFKPRDKLELSYQIAAERME